MYIQKKRRHTRTHTHRNLMTGYREGENERMNERQTRRKKLHSVNSDGKEKEVKKIVCMCLCAEFFSLLMINCMNATVCRFDFWIFGQFLVALPPSFLIASAVTLSKQR